jgi:hypothetical protein
VPDSLAVIRVRREFLSVFHSIYFVSWFLVHEVCGRFVLECRTVLDEVDYQWVHHRWSVFVGALLEVWVAISDSPPLLSDGPRPPRGQSAQTVRTVRMVLCRLPKSLAY